MMHITIRKYRCTSTAPDNWRQAQDNTWRVIVNGVPVVTGLKTREEAHQKAEEYRAKHTVVCANCGQNVIEVGTIDFAADGLRCVCGHVTKRRTEVEK